MSPITELIGGAKAYGWGSFARAVKAFESIATVSVDSGGAASVTFSSIPATYSHLQIRMLNKTVATSGDYHSPRITMNSDSGNNYTLHSFRGYSTTIDVGNVTSASALYGGVGTSPSSNPAYANMFGISIVDILDYANTNKNKTIKALAGYDANAALSGPGAGHVSFNSGVWLNTSAITSINIFADPGSNFKQYSSFALYGIKGA
jgi:hypothetical protein